MCQWIKKYHDIHDNGGEYDAIGRRGGQDLHYILGGAKVAVMPKAGVKPAANPRPPTATTQPRAKPTPATTNKFGGGGGGASSAQVTKLEGQVAELQSNNQILDKEREFYFSKLRLIEEMIQKNGYEEHPLGDTVLKILYAGEDEEMDIDPSGDLIISAGGQRIVHSVQKADQKGDADKEMQE